MLIGMAESQRAAVMVPGSSAELIFSNNGSLYTVGPNALLEIYTAVNPQTSKRTNSVNVEVGSGGHLGNWLG